METLFTLSFLLPAKVHTIQKLHNGLHATEGRKSGKQQKESPQRLERGSARPARPLPQSGGQGEQAPAARQPGPPQSCGPRTLYLPSLSHPCAKVLQDAGRFQGGGLGSLGECLESGGTRCLGMGTQRGKGSLQE